MSWLAGLWRARQPLAPDVRARLNAYRALPPIDDAVSASAQRCVVLDVETSGLQPSSDRLLAIGAVAVTNGLVRYDDVFSVFLRQACASLPANILVHGIDGTTQTSETRAADPAQALAAFLAYIGNAPLIAFHADFDRLFINRTMRAVLDITPANVWIDLAALAPCFVPEHAHTARGLDDWMAAFDIDNYARHEALADALATAQLLQVVLARAARAGALRWSELASQARAQRWLERQRS